MKVTFVGSVNPSYSDIVLIKIYPIIFTILHIIQDIRNIIKILYVTSINQYNYNNI